MMFISVLKRSSTVASSVSKYYVQNLHHHVPVLFKAPESRPIFVRSFQRTSLNCSDETKGESSLDKVAENLSVDIANVFLQRINLDNYHPELEVEDRVRGVEYRGLLFYLKDLNLSKIRAHIKYVYVRPQILSLEKLEDEKTIRVDWRYVGLTTLRMAVRYIPDKLWYRTNMDKAATVWSEGTSTYHIDEDFKIYRIVVEKPMKASNEETAKPSHVAIQQKF